MITLTEGTNRKDIGLEPIYIEPLTAILQGMITDAKTGESISGVTVGLIGTSYSAMSSGNGYYEITNIPIGNYIIRFSHPDYETLEV